MQLPDDESPRENLLSAQIPVQACCTCGFSRRMLVAQDLTGLEPHARPLDDEHPKKSLLSVQVLPDEPELPERDLLSAQDLSSTAHTDSTQPPFG